MDASPEEIYMRNTHVVLLHVRQITYAWDDDVLVFLVANIDSYYSYIFCVRLNEIIENHLRVCSAILRNAILFLLNIKCLKVPASQERFTVQIPSAQHFANDNWHNHCTAITSNHQIEFYSILVVVKCSTWTIMLLTLLVWRCHATTHKLSQPCRRECIQTVMTQLCMAACNTISNVAIFKRCQRQLHSEWSAYTNTQ